MLSTLSMSERGKQLAHNVPLVADIPLDFWLGQNIETLNADSCNWTGSEGVKIVLWSLPEYL